MSHYWKEREGGELCAREESESEGGGGSLLGAGKDREGEGRASLAFTVFVIEVGRLLSEADSVNMMTDSLEKRPLYWSPLPPHSLSNSCVGVNAETGRKYGLGFTGDPLFYGRSESE